MEIDKKLVKEQIKTKSANIAFKVFNVDRTKNREFIQFALLKVKINEYKEQIDVAVTNLNGTDIFLEHDWLVKHNPEINQNIETIQFTRYTEYNIRT